MATPKLSDIAVEIPGDRRHDNFQCDSRHGKFLYEVGYPVFDEGADKTIYIYIYIYTLIYLWARPFENSYSNSKILIL
jgi:hypothetical protein